MSLRLSEAAIARPCGMEGCRRCRAAAPDCVSDEDETRPRIPRARCLGQPGT